MLQCRKAGKKLDAFTKIRKLWLLHKGQKAILPWKLLLNLNFVIPHLFECLAGDKLMYGKVIYMKDHWRAPNNGVSPFEKLLQKDRPATIHQTNWELLVPELFKVKNNISKDSITYFLFKRNNVRYSFRSRSDFSLKRVKSVN